MYPDLKPTTSSDVSEQLALLLLGCLVTIIILVACKLLGYAKPKAKPEGGETSVLRLETDNIRIQCSIGNGITPSKLTPSTPCTPASKGDDTESASIDEVLSKNRYFIASVQLDDHCSVFSTFGLNPSLRMVSHMDQSKPLFYIDQSRDSMVRFTISSLTYQWDVECGTLFIVQSQAGSDASQLTWSEIQLYKTHEQARAALVDSLRLEGPDVSSHSDSISPPPTNESTPSPPVVPDAPLPFANTDVFYSLPEVGFFGPSPSKEDIDGWVDRAVSTHQAVREGTDMKCPETGCSHASRRPSALKIHLYTHYRIKPYTCEICQISVLTEANLLRHMQNVHICPGCHVRGPIPAMKSHKATCLLAKSASTLTKVAPSRRNPKKDGKVRSSLTNNAASRWKF